MVGLEHPTFRLRGGDVSKFQTISLIDVSVSMKSPRLQVRTPHCLLDFLSCKILQADRFCYSRLTDFVAVSTCLY